MIQNSESTEVMAKLEDVCQSDALISYALAEYSFLIVTNTSFENLYAYEMIFENGDISWKQKAFYFIDGIFSLQDYYSGQRNLSRPIYPVDDLEGSSILASISVLAMGNELEPKSEYFAVLCTQETMNLILNSFKAIIKQVREAYPEGLTVKTRNQRINRELFLLFHNLGKNIAIEKEEIPRQNKQERKLQPIFRFVPDYCVIDIETTGLDLIEDEITELAAVRVRNHNIVDSFQILLNPGRLIPPEVELLTGITNAMVADQPSLDEVKDVFLDFIGNDILVGHNILGFDAKFINAKIPGQPICHKAADTLRIARKVFGGSLGNLKLSTIADAFGIQCENAHRALADTETTHFCYEQMATFAKENHLVIESARFKDWKASDIVADSEEAVDQRFLGKIFVITGELGCMERKEAFQRVVNLGGIVKDSVVKKTDYLVVGDNQGSQTTKYKRAIDLQAGGSLIKIIKAEEFLDMIG